MAHHFFGIAVASALLLFLFFSGCGSPKPVSADVNALADPAGAFQVLWGRQAALDDVSFDYRVQVAEFPIGGATPVLQWNEWRKSPIRKSVVTTSALGSSSTLTFWQDDKRRVLCSDGGFFSSRLRCSEGDVNVEWPSSYPLSILANLAPNSFEVSPGRILLLGSRPCDTLEIKSEAATLPKLLGLEDTRPQPMEIEVCLDHELGFVQWLDARVPENAVSPDWNQSKSVLKIRLIDFSRGAPDENLFVGYPFSIGSVHCSPTEVDFPLMPFRKTSHVGVDLIDPNTQIIRQMLVPIKVDPFFSQDISLVSDFNARAIRVCDLNSKFCVGSACAREAPPSN